MDQNQELLITKAQQGNIQAFEQLVHQYDKQVMRIVANMISDREDARDLYQEIFIKVFKSIQQFRFQSEFSTWLFRIAVNTCISHRRKYSSQPLFSIDDLDDQEWTPVVKENPEHHLLAAELQNQLDGCIEKLAPKEKAVFVLRHYHEYKLKEIAEILDCKEGTVKNYLFRAVHKLQKELKEFR
jgi:RNA polymerase sigma-70 factor, ECF subfamily